MARTSRIGAAQAGLRSLLEVRRALAGNPLADVEIDEGWPPKGPQKEHVWIAAHPRSPAEQKWQTTGPNASKDESFRLLINCLVTKSTESYAETRDRALALAGEVEIAVRADATLGGAVMNAEVATTDLDEAVGPNLRQVLAVVEIACEAVLTSV